MVTADAAGAATGGDVAALVTAALTERLRGLPAPAGSALFGGRDFLPCRSYEFNGTMRYGVDELIQWCKEVGGVD